MRRLLLVLLLLVAPQGWAAAPQNPLEVELVCESRSILPGTPFQAGLLLQHPAAYHSYWQFPGIVGVPTSLKWDLPPGWKAGPLQWPTPERVWMFKIKAQGFHGRVLVPVEITPPGTLPPGKPVRIAATASWMCCGRDCNPGHKKLELQLQPADTTPAPDPGLLKDFATARNSVPGSVPGWNLSARRTGSAITLKVHAASPAAHSRLPHLDSVTFFTLDGLTDANRQETLHKVPDGFVLELGISEFAPRPFPGELRGVLSAPEGWLPGNPRRGMSVQIPLE